MKTPEEIKKGLECCGNSGKCKGCPYYGGYELCVGTLAEDALAYVQQLEQRLVEVNKTSPRWISVGERLPENGALVVALCRYDFAPSRYYLLHERYDLRSNFWHDGSAQYWIQLPEPPKEEHHD